VTPGLKRKLFSWRKTTPSVPPILTPSRGPSNFSLPLSRGERPWKDMRLDFPGGWGEGPVFDWYRGLDDTRIDRLELRKQHDIFQHEYILVVLMNEHIYRFERRPDPKVPIDTIMRSGCAAVDTFRAVPTVLDAAFDSDRVVELRFQGEVDLSTVSLICYGIHQDNVTRRHSLQKFNCYFFAWAIIVVGLRHALFWQGVTSFDGNQECPLILECRGGAFDMALCKSVCRVLINLMNNGTLLSELVEAAEAQRRASGINCGNKAIDEKATAEDTLGLLAKMYYELPYHQRYEDGSLRRGEESAQEDIACFLSNSLYLNSSPSSITFRTNLQTVFVERIAVQLCRRLRGVFGHSDPLFAYLTTSLRNGLDWKNVTPFSRSAWQNKHMPDVFRLHIPLVRQSLSKL
jgi:hypothetical protein